MKKKAKPWLGKTLPEEMKGKIAAGRTRFAAGNEPKALRAEINSLVIKKDLYKCRRCGQSGLLGQSLSVEVLDKNKSVLDLNNLATVCKNCLSDCSLTTYCDISGKMEK